MPEGDTVWLAGQRLNAALSGQELTRTDFRVPSLATTDLSGHCVLAVVSRGKHLLTRISGGLSLHTHFRMDGSWHLYRPGTIWHGGPDWQIRLILSTQSWDAIGYRMPVVELIPSADEARVVGHLGPDLLGADWDPAEAVRRLLDEPDREIGQALLDQRNLAGIGNLYKAESLFLQGLNPWTPTSEVADLPSLVATAARLLEVNKSRSAQCTTGDLGRGRTHWVFERGRGPCRRCGTTIRSAMQGQAPQERISYWCPRCQPGPEPVAADRLRRPQGRARYRP